MHRVDAAVVVGVTARTWDAIVIVARSLRGDRRFLQQYYYESLRFSYYLNFDTEDILNI